MAEVSQAVDLSKLRWLPLESSPVVLNSFSKRMGLPDSYAWGDVYGLDPALLSMVPQPVVAVCLLFPSSQAQRDAKEAQRKAIAEKGQTVSDNLWYCKQVDGIGNACGSIAAIHSLANIEGVTLNEGPLSKFMTSTKGKTPDERGQDLLKAKDIQEQADNTASDSTMNQTATPERDAKVNAHFIAFTLVDGCVYELDGRKAFPINHGKSTSGEFLSTVAGVVQKEFMAKDPTNLNFNICALSKTS